MDESIGVEIPSHFLCPISLQLMRDPVIVSTGITYERESIERWLYSCKNATCPVTKQSLPDTSDPFTPNHTLRRFIQSWCTLNASHFTIPTPKPLVDRAQIAKIINDAQKHVHRRLVCLQQLRSIASESERSRRILVAEEFGIVHFLVSILVRDHESVNIISEALHVLYKLDISESNLKDIIKSGQRDDFVAALVRSMKTSGDYQSRVRAIIILRSIFKVGDPMQLISIQPELFREVVQVLSDQISHQASKAALKLLVELCPWGRNRIKAVEGGAVHVLIELMLGINNSSNINPDDRRSCELMLMVLDMLCGCADGREELLKHGAGLAIVSKKILRVSHMASDRAVRVLSSVSKFSANSRVLQEMLQVGVVSKLCLVTQVESSPKTKDRAREILKLHSRVWRNSPCISSHLLSSYPN